MTKYLYTHMLKRIKTDDVCCFHSIPELNGDWMGLWQCAKQRHKIWYFFSRYYTRQAHQYWNEVSLSLSLCTTSCNWYEKHTLHYPCSGHTNTKYVRNWIAVGLFVYQLSAVIVTNCCTDTAPMCQLSVALCVKKHAELTAATQQKWKKWRKNENNNINWHCRRNDVTSNDCS